MPFTTIKPVGQFTDINGKPLDGQVFFGQPNLDPIASPITVYWDAAGTQPVTQPVVTVGGYPMNGSTRFSRPPVMVFCPVSTSVTFQSSSEWFVWYWISGFSPRESVTSLVNQW